MIERPPEDELPAWNEADRLAALRDYAVLDTQPEASFKNFTNTAAHVCQAPVALICFIDEKRQWFNAVIGGQGQEASLDVAFSAQPILHQDLLVVPDTTEDPRFGHRSIIAGGPRFRFYAGAPLKTDDGLPLGLLCVCGVEPRHEGLTDEQSATLVALSRASMDQVKLRKANKTLHHHHMALASIADALPQMVWLAHADGHVVYRNRRSYEFTGASPGSIEGTGWANLVHPDDQDKALSAWQHSVKAGEAYEIEYRVRHHSGEYRWVLGRAQPVYDDQGKIDHWWGTYTDLHDVKRGEAALVESEKRYRALAAASAAIVWRATPHGSIMEAWGGETFIGPMPDDYKGYAWLERIHPDDQARVATAWQQHLVLGQSGTLEYRVRDLDGGAVARGVEIRVERSPAWLVFRP